MPTPSDQRIEEQLASLSAAGPGAPPEGFLGAVRARRRRVLARRAVSAGACAIALVIAVAILPRPALESDRPLSPRGPTAADDALPPSVLPEPNSMLALRRAWSSDEGSGAWLASFRVESADTERPLRLGDSHRLTSEGL
jgi:hypothetical protein